jgi:hypothetical protein
MRPRKKRRSRNSIRMPFGTTRGQKLDPLTPSEASSSAVPIPKLGGLCKPSCRLGPSCESRSAFFDFWTEFVFELACAKHGHRLLNVISTTATVLLTA